MKNKSTKRNIIEWSLLIGIPLVIYLAGWQTEVLGTIQRFVLSTGLMKPKFLPPAEQLQADYNMQLQSFDGKLVSLEDFRGKTIFINFWASWCPPCVAEMPAIEKLYNKVKSSEVIFFMINLDDEKAKADAFLTSKNCTLPNFRIAGAIPGVFQSSTIPTSFVISPQGKIVIKVTGMSDYDNSEFINSITKLSQKK